MAKPNIFGAAPKLQRFTEPAPEDREYDNLSIKDEVGSVVVFDVVERTTQKTNKYGVKPVVRVNADVIRASGETKHYEDQLIFAAAIIDQLTPFAGQQVVAKIAGYESSYGTTGYKLETPSDEEAAEAEQWAKAPY